MASQYKLHYFNFKGRGELIRYVFHAAGVEFEDVRFTREEWGSEHKAKAPSGQCPWIEFQDGADKVELWQSVSIARYLSRKYGFAGDGELEQARVDVFADQVSDFLNEFVKVFFETDAKKKAELVTKLHDEIEPFQLGIFERQLAKNPDGNLVGSSLTYADFYLAIVASWLGERQEAVLANFPHVKKLVEKVNSHPNIAAWIAKRPVTDL